MNKKTLLWRGNDGNLYCTNMFICICICLPLSALVVSGIGNRNLPWEFLTTGLHEGRFWFWVHAPVGSGKSQVECLVESGLRLAVLLAPGWRKGKTSLEEYNLNLGIKEFPQIKFEDCEFTIRPLPFSPLTQKEISHHRQELIEKTHYRISST